MLRINREMQRLAAEFRRQPFGRHSAALEQLLSLFRSAPIKDKHCLICIKPHQEWMLARLSGVRGTPPTIEGNRVFRSLAEAEWEVFKLRWKNLSGVALLDEDLDRLEVELRDEDNSRL
jgi:hypothetical protein